MQHKKVFGFFVVAAFIFVVVVVQLASKEFTAAHMISHDIHPALHFHLPEKQQSKALLLLLYILMAKGYIFVKLYIIQKYI